MEKKKLGNTDLQVAPLTFGGNVFGWTIDEKTSFELLDAFVSGGFNLIDTADVYSRWGSGNSGGESETIIGNWLKLRGNRDKAIIATKVGSDMGQGKRDISKAYILKAVEDSLRRLRTDYIDLYQTHWDVESTPVEETLEAYSQLVKEGKVRWIGASNLSAERLKASLEASKRYNFPVYQTFQPEYNLYAREGLEKELLGICLENNIGIINYYSLASGFLTGKYRSAADFGKSARGGGMNAYLNERGLNILKALDTVSERHQTSPASVAIAWLIAKPGITAPIASATNLNQLDALIEATKLKLTNEDMILLDYASAWH